MGKLTEEMITTLNKELEAMGSGIRMNYSTDSLCPTSKIQILDPNGFVESTIINCTDKFYEWLEKWFKDNYDVKLHYNNTRSTIWSWDKE